MSSDERLDEPEADVSVAEGGPHEEADAGRAQPPPGEGDATASGGEADRAAEAARLEAAQREAARLEAAQLQATRLEDRLRRCLADTDNLRKRFAKDLDRERAAERLRMAGAWLRVVDNLELALQHADADPSPVVEGVRAVHAMAVATLAQFGFPRFDAEGETFNPVLHEAMGSVPDEGRAGTVVSVIRPGYGTAEALLRPAGVVVAVR